MSLVGGPVSSVAHWAEGADSKLLLGALSCSVPQPEDRRQITSASI